MAGLRTLAGLLAGLAATTALGTATATQALAAKAGPSCSGANVTLETDYTFTGAGFQANKTFLVRIVTPNGYTFWPTAGADATGAWTETWLADQAGTYTATAFGNTGKVLATCSLSAS
jgi:hypothetical protein